MILPMWRKPNAEQVRVFLSGQSNQSFSYAMVGMTQHTAPAKYQVDHNRVQLGHGGETFDQACVALQTWRMFDLGWVLISPSTAPISEGTTVAMVATAFGLWFVNACRIVYVVDERIGDLWRFGFAYGTLPAHLERGEERFLIEWDRGSDLVSYDILAYSQPHALLAKLGYLVVRHFQKRFAEDSKRVMGEGCCVK